MYRTASRTDGNYQGCPNHSGSPRLTPTGNSTFSTEVSEHIKRVKKATKKNQVRGAEPLDPMEQLKVLHYLLSKNSLWEMQFAVIQTLLISLYCRGNDLFGPQEDGSMGIQVSDISLDHCHIGANGKVEYLVLDVCGKTDQHNARLVIWRNRRTAVFCPVRFLIWWLSITGIMEGYEPLYL